MKSLPEPVVDALGVRLTTLLTVLLTALTLFACKSEPASQDTAPTAPPATKSLAAPGNDTSDVSADTSDSTDAEDPDKNLPREIGRVDMVGFAYAMAIDDAGRVVVTTREGRNAAYLYLPEAAPGIAPAALELTDAALTPFAIGDGLFALPQPKGLVIARARAGTPATLEEHQRIEFSGDPAAVRVAQSKMWVALRQADAGESLQAIDLRTGQVLATYDAGATPIDILTHDDAVLVTRVGESNKGQILVLPPPDASGQGAMRQLEMDGIPLHSVHMGDTTWIVRRGESNLLPLTGKPLELGSPVDVPIVVRNAVTAGDVIIITDGLGSLVRVNPENGSTSRWEVGRGTTRMTMWGPEQLLVLDPQSKRLVLLDTDPWREVSALPLEPPFGFLLADHSRGRVYVTQPQRSQLAVLEFPTRD